MGAALENIPRRDSPPGLFFEKIMVSLLIFMVWYVIIMCNYF